MMGRLVALALMLTGVGCTGVGPQAKETVVTTGQDVAGDMGVVIPPGAVVEHAERINGRDAAARLVVVLPEAAWHAWCAQLVPDRPDQPAFSAAENYELGPDEGSWAPSRAPGLTTVQLRWRGAEALNIGQSPAGAGRVRGFLFWFRT